MANTPLHIPALVERQRFIDYRQQVRGNSFNWSWNRRPDEVLYLVVHHSVTEANKEPRAQVDEIADIHVDTRGWGGIGYHFVITDDGTAWYVGDVGTARANVKNINEKVIGICLVGDFTQHNPTDEQILSAHDLCQFFLSQHSVWPKLHSWEASVRGHKELQSTACPGTSWKGAPDSLFERIKNRIPYNPQIPVGDTVPKQQYDDVVLQLNELKAKIKEAEALITEAKKALEKVDMTT